MIGCSEQSSRRPDEFQCMWQHCIDWQVTSDCKALVCPQCHRQKSDGCRASQGDRKAVCSVQSCLQTLDATSKTKELSCYFLIFYLNYLDLDSYMWLMAPAGQRRYRFPCPSFHLQYDGNLICKFMKPNLRTQGSSGDWDFQHFEAEGSSLPSTLTSPGAEQLLGDHNWQHSTCPQ